MTTPTAVTITQAVLRSSTLTVSWTASTDATQYIVTFEPSTLREETKTVDAPLLSTTFTIPTSGYTYTVRVIASNSSGNSSPATRTVDDIGNGLVAWIDASDPSRNEILGARNWNGVDYGIVQRVLDKSGRNHHFVAPNSVISGSFREGPAYVNNFSNLTTDMSYFNTTISKLPTQYTFCNNIEKPGYLFRGRHSRLSNGFNENTLITSLGYPQAGLDNRQNPQTIFLVCKDWHDGSFIGHLDNGSAYAHYSLKYVRCAIQGDAPPNFIEESSNSKTTMPNLVINSWFNTPGNTNMSFNGTRRTSNGSYCNTNHLVLNGRTNNNTETFLCELLAYNRVFNDNEISMIEGYLATKWGLQSSLPASHAYKTTAYADTINIEPSLLIHTPTIINNPIVNLSTIREDTVNTFGSPISSILNSTITAYTPWDFTDQRNMAIYGADTANGRWEYTLDSGSNWTTMPQVSSSSFLLLTGIGNSNRVRFIPNSNYNLSSFLYFRGWDGLTGLPGQLYEPTALGKYTPFSEGTATVVQPIASVIDAPLLLNTPSIVISKVLSNTANPRGVTVQKIIELLGSNYVLTESTHTAGIAIFERTGSGTWQYSNNSASSWTNIPSVTTTSHFLLSGVDATRLVRFVPNSNILGDYTFRFRAWNSSGVSDSRNENVTGPGTSSNTTTIRYSADTATATIRVVETFSSPILTDSSSLTLTSFNEDTTTNGDSIQSLVTTLGANLTSEEDAFIPALAVFNTSNANGTWQYSTNSGSSWINIPALNANQYFILTSEGGTYRIRFSPIINYNGQAQFSFRGYDAYAGNGATTVSIATPGTTLLSLGQGTATVQIPNINDAPVLTGSYTLQELNTDSGEDLIVSVQTILTNFTIVDPDTADTSSYGMAVVSADSSKGTWYYSRDGEETWIEFPNVSESSALHFNRLSSESIRFVPISDASGPAYIQFCAWDKSNENTLVDFIGDASIRGGTTAYSSNLRNVQTSLYRKPVAPQTIQATYSQESSVNCIKLTITQPTDLGNKDFKQYNIYEVVDDLFGLVTTTTLSNVSIFDVNFVYGQTYIYKVTTVNSADLESDLSESVSVLFAGRPQIQENTSIQLASIEQDTTSPDGESIASIITKLGQNYVSYFANDPKGIAIYNIDTQFGAWQYKTSAMDTWAPIPTLSVNQQFITSAQDSAQIRFVPIQGYVGTVSMKIRAWNMYEDSELIHQVVQYNSNSYAYSTDFATASLQVTYANTAPVLTGSYAIPSINISQTIQPISVSTILSNLTITDVDQELNQIVPSIAIIATNSTIGTWYYSIDGTTWNTLATVSLQTAVHLLSSDLLKFVPYSETSVGTTSLTIRGWDRSNENMIVNRIGDATYTGLKSYYSENTRVIEAQIIGAPTSPTSISATWAPPPQAIGDDGDSTTIINRTIQLSWSAPTNDGNDLPIVYKVYKFLNGSPESEPLFTTNLLSVTISNGLVNGTEYTFGVFAENSSGQSQIATTTFMYRIPPVLNLSSELQMVSILEDAVNPEGVTISSLVSDCGEGYTPIDVGDEQGFAIYSVSTEGGFWQYSLNSGETWSNIVNVNSTKSLALLSNDTNRIRFLPQTNWYGTAQLQFRAWDAKNSVNSGEYILGTYTDTYLSEGTGLITVEIQSENDSPSFTGTYQFPDLLASSAMTPVSVQTIMSAFTVTDIDIADTNPGLAILSATNTGGEWQYSIDNAQTWQPTTSLGFPKILHLSNSLSNLLKFVPTSLQTNTTASLTVRIWDGSNQVENGTIEEISDFGGNSPYSSTSTTLPLNVTGVLASPQSVGISLTGAAIRLSWSVPSNPNNAPPPTQYNIYRVLSPGNETLLTTTSSLLTDISLSFVLGQVYQFRVSAVNSVGEGSKSDVIYIVYTTHPDIATGVRSISHENSIIIQWTPPQPKPGQVFTTYKIIDKNTNQTLYEIHSNNLKLNNNTYTIEILNMPPFVFRELVIEVGTTVGLTSRTSSVLVSYPYSINNATESSLRSTMDQILARPNSEATLWALLSTISGANNVNSKIIIIYFLNKITDLYAINNSPDARTTTILQYLNGYIGIETVEIIKKHVIAVAIDHINTFKNANLGKLNLNTIMTNIMALYNSIDTMENISNLKIYAKEEIFNSMAAKEKEDASNILSLVNIMNKETDKKSMIIDSLIKQKSNQRIILSGEDIALIKENMTNRLPELDNFTKITMKIPNQTNTIINLDEEDDAIPTYVIMKEDVSYTFRYKQNDVGMKYSLANLYKDAQSLTLGEIIQFGPHRFKVVQIGSATLFYIPQQTSENTSTTPTPVPINIPRNSSELTSFNQNLTQYCFVSTMKAVTPGQVYQYKSQTERIQALMGKLTKSQGYAFRKDGTC